MFCLKTDIKEARQIVELSDRQSKRERERERANGQTDRQTDRQINRDTLTLETRRQHLPDKYNRIRDTNDACHATCHMTSNTRRETTHKMKVMTYTMRHHPC